MKRQIPLFQFDDYRRFLGLPYQRCRIGTTHTTDDTFDRDHWLASE